jgi:hypothetical protein
MKTLLSMLVLSALLFSNCKKDNGNDDPGDDLNVYLSGSDMTGDGSSPCYWKNDTRTNLPNTGGGDGYDISVDGANVFTAGRTWADLAQTRSLPCYWLNGTRKELEVFHVRSSGIARSILAFNGTVYSAGVCSDSLTFFANSGWRNIPCYWKNDDIIRLEMLDGFGNASASSVALVAAPNRVITFIGGTSYAPSGYDEPCYWKIDPMEITTPDAEIEPAALPDKGFGGTVRHVSSGNGQIMDDIYFAGFVDDEDGVNNPCYWHNGERTDLSKINQFDHGVANAIDYAENTVYVAGYTDNDQGSRVPCIWKNGTRTDLTMPADANGGEATSCKVVDGNVYVSGTISTPGGEFPCYWKNGELVQYSTRGKATGIALGN